MWRDAIKTRMTGVNAFIPTLLKLIRPRGLERLSLAPPYILIALVPIAVFISLEIFVGIFAKTPNISLFAPTNDISLQWTETAARLQFFSLFVLFVWFSAAVSIKFLCDLLCLFDRDSRYWLTFAFGLCAVAGVAVIGSAWLGVLPRTYEYFGWQIFDEALKSAGADTGSQNIGKLAKLLKWNWDWKSFEGVLLVVNIAAGLAVPAFITGGISCLAVAAATDQKEAWIAARKEAWIKQRERLKNYIYLSASLLVVALVFLKSWTHYPSFVLEKDATKLAAFNAVVNSFSVWTGIEYTLLLAAYAVPVSFFLSREADEIAQEILETSGGTIPDIRAREKLTISTQDAIKTVIALLSPLVTGSIATLASIVSKT